MDMMEIYENARDRQVKAFEENEIIRIHYEHDKLLEAVKKTLKLIDNEGTDDAYFAAPGFIAIPEDKLTSLCDDLENLVKTCEKS